MQLAPPASLSDEGHSSLVCHTPRSSTVSDQNTIDAFPPSSIRKGTVHESTDKDCVPAPVRSSSRCSSRKDRSLPLRMPFGSPLKLPVSIFPAAASGRSSPLCSVAARISGSMSRCSLAGRRKASISGIPEERNPRSGSLISRRRTRITRP